MRLQQLAGPEGEPAARRDLDVVACLGIPPLAGALVAQDEVPESGDLDLFSVFQDILHRIKDRLDDILRLFLRKAACFLVHDLYQVSLRHRVPPSDWNYEVRIIPPNRFYNRFTTLARR